MKRVIMVVFILGLSVGMAFGQLPDPVNVVVPYMLKAPAPITVDGVLDEWSFAFPVTFNQKTIHDSMRAVADGWIVTDDENCSGTIWMMYDDEYFYFAAKVMDDEPGHFSDASWAADAIEFYFANWDVGDAIVPSDTVMGWIDDPATGAYSFQLNVSFDESEDIVLVNAFYGPTSPVESENTEVVYAINDDGDQYILEGRIYLEDLTSATTGNTFEFPVGGRMPCMWSLYDIDETESSADFQGYAYTLKGYPGWQGISPGWQVCDVLETARGDVWNMECAFDFVSPYIRMATAWSMPEIDGVLNDWNFCFPVDFNTSTMGDSSRPIADGWVVTDDESCSGTLMMQYDTEYFYFAAHVNDDEPGHFSDASWAADAIEYYMGNWDIGDAIVPSDTVQGWIDDAATGDYSFQLNVSFDESEDSIALNGFYGPASPIQQVAGGTEAVYAINDDGDEYILEGKILLDDLVSTTTGNYFEFMEGYRLPFMWSLYDIDETESSADFKGYAFTKKGFPGWQGISPGWQYADVKGMDFVEYQLHWFIDQTDVEPLVRLPDAFRLTNYPNPFNPGTKLQYVLEQSGPVNLHVYNLSGQLIRTLLENAVRQAGTYEVSLDLRDLPSGVYFSVLEQGDQRVTQKMMLMK